MWLLPKAPLPLYKWMSRKVSEQFTLKNIAEERLGGAQVSLGFCALFRLRGTEGQKLNVRRVLLGGDWDNLELSSVQFSSAAQSCPTLCDPMNCSTPGLPVHHQLPEFTQTHIHRVSDAIQPSHPLWSPSPPAPSPSQHQSLFQWGK